MSSKESKHLNRRSFLKKSLGAGAGLAVAHLGISCSGEYTGAAELPNIIFITADDLGWKDIGCYGNHQIRTPHLDGLARAGALFRNAFGVTSSCSSARASFMTGQYPHTHGVTGLAHIHVSRGLGLLADTMASLLYERGYNTALEGKWHVSPYLPAGWYGYDERLSGIFAKDMVIQNTDQTRSFLHRNRANRFFIEINFMNNHRDAVGAFDFDPRFPVDPDKLQIPAYMHLPEDIPELKVELAQFFSQTMAMDAMIGEILQTLDELNIADNTLVLFVSDNGAPFPGSKMTLYDRGIGTPLIARWPRFIPDGQTIDALVSTIDILPTILEAVGIAIPNPVQGESFLGNLTGSGIASKRDYIAAEMTDHAFYIPTRAVRTRQWKYIKNYSSNAIGLDQLGHMEWAHALCERSDQPWNSPRIPEELYDLRTDPLEQKNLVNNSAEQSTLAAMRRLLRVHQQATQDPFLDAEFTDDYDSDDYRVYAEPLKGDSPVFKN